MIYRSQAVVSGMERVQSWDLLYILTMCTVIEVAQKVDVL